jgi:hypothetical protein
MGSSDIVVNHVRSKAVRTRQKMARQKNDVKKLSNPIKNEVAYGGKHEHLVYHVIP